MFWPEVETVKKENRHELVLNGAQITKRIEKSGLDAGIFTATSLNYLDIHGTCLDKLPDAISNLVNLQSLVLHSNKLTEITAEVVRLEKLKMLDLSRNAIATIPDDFTKLRQLTTLNVSSNKLTEFPKLCDLPKLQILNLANNQLTNFPDVCYKENGISDLYLQGNKIADISPEICVLSTLKIIDLSNNAVKIVPSEIAKCAKIKEINLKYNPIADRRLYKLIEQCRTKQIMDYIRQHSGSGDNSTKKTTKPNKDVAVEVQDDALKINVQRFKDDTVKIVINEPVKKLREHILACLIHGVEFDESSFKKFIQLQSKLHDSICDKRNSATIATHDAGKIEGDKLFYTALPSKSLIIKPLNKTKECTGEELYQQLQTEAENLRKEKKRNVYSGIHKYLYLLEGKALYPALLDAKDQVISFPPIVNSDLTKISVDTKSILVEVTSDVNQSTCKKVLDTLIKETLLLFGKDLIIQQVKTTDKEGNLKSVYPSKTDLNYENNGICVLRE